MGNNFKNPLIMTTTPPFYVGQRVVAIKNVPHYGVYKYERFTVTGVKPGCCCWIVQVGVSGPGESYLCLECSATGTQPTDDVYFSHDCFAPILPEMKQITYSRIIEKEPVCVN